MAKKPNQKITKNSYRRGEFDTYLVNVSPNKIIEWVSKHTIEPKSLEKTI